MNLNDEGFAQRVTQVWGELRATPKDKAKLIADYKRRLAPVYRKRFDRAAGAKLFEKNCANCHQLVGRGGKIGPDLTGSQRFNLDYMLENLIDPSAAVPKDYQMEIVLTDAGVWLPGWLLRRATSR